MGGWRRSEELLPEAADLEIDDRWCSTSPATSSELEVVGEGGSMPTPAMVAWARAAGRQLVHARLPRPQRAGAARWQGLRKQLTLFVSPQGRGILFQQHRLAAFLQAGLLVPAQEESLTVRPRAARWPSSTSIPAGLLN